MEDREKRSPAPVDDLLAASFKALVLRRPIEKITIREITDGAGVIRPTFYNHFQDKYELLEWIVRKELVEPSLPEIREGHSRRALLRIFEAAQEQKEFYTNARKLEGQNSFASIVLDCIAGAMREVREGRELRKTLPGQLSLDEVILYYANSLCFLILRWIDTGMKTAPEEMVELYAYVRHHGFEDLYKDEPGGEAP